MKNPFATNNKLGLPFTNPVNQTMLPVICGGNGNIRGYLAITSTEFDGTETEYETDDGPIPVVSVTLPPKATDGSGYGVQQYMAAYFENKVERLRPWVGYTQWVDINDIQYDSRWLQPTIGSTERINRGPLITNLLVNMDNDVTVPPIPSPPTTANATVYWAAAMKLDSAQLECGFFDFNWLTAFQAKSTAKALRIEVVSNPPGGAFKSSMVPVPAITPYGFVEYTTVRIIKLQNVVAGDYVFNYMVYDDLGQGTPCVLTLKIV